MVSSLPFILIYFIIYIPIILIFYVPYNDSSLRFEHNIEDVMGFERKTIKLRNFKILLFYGLAGLLAFFITYCLCLYL